MVTNDTKPPDLLYLQWHGDGEPDDFGSVCESEVTHHRNRIFEHDILYLRVPDMSPGGARAALGPVGRLIAEVVQGVVIGACEHYPAAVLVLLAAALQKQGETDGPVL